MEPTYQVVQPPQSQSSVEVQRYKDGTYGYSFKKYDGSPLPTVADLALYDGLLKARFVTVPPDLAEQLEASIAAARLKDGGGA